MNRIGLTLLAVTMVTACAAAQTQSGAQGGAQQGAQASADASKQGRQASGSGSAAASGAAQVGQNSTSLAGGSTFNAALSAPLDSKKCKPGDPVNARTTEAAKSDGKSVFPKGTKLVGHVTQASARGKGDPESALGIVFDKAVLKNGEEVPLSVTIQAIASSETSARAAGSDIDTMGGLGTSTAGPGTAGGRGPLGGVTSAAGGTAGNSAANVGGTTRDALNAAGQATGSVASTSSGAIGGLDAAGRLASNSQGVFGLNGLNLSSTASNSTPGSLITSAGKNVHLDSGTQILLVTQTGSAPPGESKQPTSESQPRPDKPNQK
jgi:hypothetical protein